MEELPVTFWNLPREDPSVQYPLSLEALMGEGSEASSRSKTCHKNPRKEGPVSTCTIGDPRQQNGRELPAETQGHGRFTEALH